jgi:coenzyme F420-dependent glucose-6-phosphate dehydrogenase
MSETIQLWFAAATEEFTPSEMLEQARAAEAAGFDGLASSDHFAPWFPDGQGSQAWMFLAAAGRDTTGPLGTSVTPLVHHYHPGVIAQAFMSLEELYPGRVFLGAGSGEALNEVPLGLDWPSPEEQIERMDRALDAIARLWAGETVTMDGGWFRLKEAKLYTRARGRPRLYVSAFGPQAAAVAGRHGDGLWTLGDPEQAPEIVEAYRGACRDHGRGPGEIIFQSGFHLAGSDEAAIAATRRWKPTQLDAVYGEDLYDPAEMLRIAEEQVSDEQLAKEGFLVGADPAEHVDRIGRMREAGATVICLQGIGADGALESIRRYGEEVLPAVRGG